LWWAMVWGSRESSGGSGGRQQREIIPYPETMIMVWRDLGKNAAPLREEEERGRVRKDWRRSGRRRIRCHPVPYQ
jgi:hypothetical protein